MAGDPPEKDGDMPGEATIIGLPGHVITGTIINGRSVDEAGQPSTETAVVEEAVLAATAETQPQQIFTPSSRSTVLGSLGLTEGKRSPAKAPSRQVTYLIIDAATARGPQAYLTLKSEIGLIKDARDFQVTQDNQGNIVIISLSERGGLQKLLGISASIVRKIPTTARMALKSGITEYAGNDFSIAGYPQTSADAIWRTAATPVGGTRVFIDQELARTIADPGNRLGSGIEITTAGEAANFLALTSFRNRIRLEQGGPDRIIGYENQLENLEIYTGMRLEGDDDDDESQKTKLVVLKGSAGMGKSRLLAEVLAKHPSYILASVDAADKNVVGSSLVTIATQLITALTDSGAMAQKQIEAKYTARLIIDGELVLTGDETPDTTPITLIEFAALSHSDQVEFAAKHPQAIADLCGSALEELTFWKDPNTLFVLEDMHHADRVSLPFLTQLIARYLKNTEGRAVMSMRPEEMYRSTAVEDLETEVGEKQIAEVSVTKGLDLDEDETLAHDFAFYSLPTEIRKDRRIGPWFKTLAKAAGKSPWVMKSLMDTVLEHLIITSDLIDVDREILDRIGRINPTSTSDVATYFHERIESLDEATRKLLQAIALMGGKANSTQISAIATRFGRYGEALMETIQKLVSEGYLQKLDENTYGLQHEATRAIVIGSLRDEKTKIDLATDVHNQLRDDAEIRPDARHELLSIIAQSRDFAPVTGEIFWQDYAQATDDSLDHARDHNDTATAHKIATAVLASPILQAEIAKLKTGKTSPEAILKLAITALFAQAENARLLGKFDEVDDTVATLQAIHEHQPEVIDLDRAHIIRFLKAYMVPNTKAMREVFEHDLALGSRLPTPVRVMLEIKLAYRENRFDAAIKLFKTNSQILFAHSNEYQAKHKTPLPELIEIMRIATANCTLENARQRIIHPYPELVFDQDVVMQPSAVGDRERTDIAEARKALEYIGIIKASFPLILDAYSELNIMDQLATIAAFEGDHEKSDRLFRETWRVAMQMKVYPAAARAAKLQGDVRIIQALQGKNINRQKVLEAIAIYSEQGFDLALEHMSPESGYQRLLRIQRIRAVGILLRSHALGFEPGENGDLARNPVLKNLKPYIEQALADFKYLNESWPQTAQDKEMCYDIMGYMNYILYLAQDLSKRPEASGLRVHLDENLYSPAHYPMMDIEAVRSGKEFGDTGVTDYGFGEVDRKRRGLNALVEALQVKNTTEAAQAQFKART